MVKLVLLLQPAQDRDGVRNARLADEHGLEAPLQRRVLLDIFAIFVERRRADAVQLAARQRRLQQIARVHRAFGFAGADERVHLVDEQDDLAGGLLHLVEHALQALLELAAIFRAGDQRAHVERQQALVLDAVGHVAVGDAQREAFGDGGLADARLADQHRIVLGPAGEHLDRAADFLVAADDRVELAFARRRGEVARIFLQRVVAVLGALRVGGAAAAQLLDRGVEVLRREARLLQRGADVGALGQRHRQQDALDGDVAVAGLLRDLLGLVENADGVAVERGRLRRAAAGDGGDLRDQRIDFALGRFGIAARRLDQPGGHALLIVEQRLQQMRGRDALMMFADGDRLGRLQEAARAIGEFLKIHSTYPFALGRDMVLPLGHTRVLVSAAAATGLARVRWSAGAKMTVGPGSERRRDLHRRGVPGRPCGCGGNGCPTLAISSGWTIGGHRRRRPGPCSSGDIWSVHVEAQEGVEAEADRIVGRRARMHRRTSLRISVLARRSAAAAPCRSPNNACARFPARRRRRR